MGAYMQFVHSITATQSTFARDIITAQGLIRHEETAMLDLARRDAALQYRFLINLETIQKQPLPLRLVTVSRITWLEWPITSSGIRSSDRWRHMMRACNCGIEVPDANP